MDFEATSTKPSYKQIKMANVELLSAEVSLMLIILQDYMF